MASLGSQVVTVAARNLWVGLEEGDKSAAFAESHDLTKYDTSF